MHQTHMPAPARMPFRGHRLLHRHAALAAAATDCRPVGPSWATLVRHAAAADRSRTLHPVVAAALSALPCDELEPIP